MAKTLKLILLALAFTTLVACGKKEDEKPKAAAPVVVSLPTDPGDNSAWKLYLSSVVKRINEGSRNSPFMYYLPASATADSEEYGRQLDNVAGVVAGGVLPGNMLAFGSPNSSGLADLVVEAFTDVQAGSMKDVRVLFIGNAADSERVKTAVEASGATFIFHEAK